MAASGLGYCDINGIDSDEDVYFTGSGANASGAHPADEEAESIGDFSITLIWSVLD